jgi:hypothetical protein
VKHGETKPSKEELASSSKIIDRSSFVRARRLELLRVAPPDPKSGASANFATPARAFFLFLQIKSIPFLFLNRKLKVSNSEKDYKYTHCLWKTEKELL